MRNTTVGRSRARLAAGALVALTALTMSGCTSTVPVHGTAAPQPPTARAATYLAMLDLAGASAARYRGTFSNSGETVKLDVTVTSAGEASGTLGVGSATISLLVLQGVTYIKAPESFWLSGGAKSSGITKRYAANWVRVPAMVFGLDVGAILAPGALARWQRPIIPDIADRPVGQAGGAQQNGDTVHVPAQDSFYELTAKQPYRLVRLHAATVPEVAKVRRVSGFVPPKPGTPVPPAPAASDLEVTVSDVSATLPAVYAKLSQQAAQLRGAIDGEGRITLGKQQFVNCGATGCTITVVFTNAGGRTIRAGLHADWDGDNKPIGVCDAITAPVTASRTATAICTISSAGWRNFYNRAISSPAGLPYGARYSVLPLATGVNPAQLAADAAAARCSGGATRPANCKPSSPASVESHDAAVRAAYDALRRKFGGSTPYGAVTAVRLSGPAAARVNANDRYPDLIVYFGDRAFVYQVAPPSLAQRAKQQAAAQLATLRKDSLTAGSVQLGPDLGGKISVKDPRLGRTITLLTPAATPGVIVYTIA